MENKDYNLISDKVFNSLNSIDDLIELMSNDKSNIDYISRFKTRLIYFKGKVKFLFPELSMDEILLFYKYYHKFGELYSIYEHEKLLAAIEYEQRSLNIDK